MYSCSSCAKCVSFFPMNYKAFPFTCSLDCQLAIFSKSIRNSVEAPQTTSAQKAEAVHLSRDRGRPSRWWCTDRSSQALRRSWVPCSLGSWQTLTTWGGKKSSNNVAFWSQQLAGIPSCWGGIEAAGDLFELAEETTGCLWGLCEAQQDPMHWKKWLVFLGTDVIIVSSMISLYVW